MADYTPDPHILLSLANQGLSWWKALAELIDNSLDAGADRVEVSIKGRTVTITDNGKGMTDIVGALRLGGHMPANGRGLGVYGVGLKDAWLSSGNKINVVTVRNGLKTELTIDTKTIGANWEGPDPVVTPTDATSGTAITLYLRAGKHSPDPSHVRKLARIFSPGIVQGKQIVYAKGQKAPVSLAAVALPEFQESVQDSFEVNGKDVQINIGILKPEGKMEDGPFWLAYRHRIIDGTSLGTKDLSGQSMGGMITLGDGWKFTKNKDGMSDDDTDRLGDAIYERIEHLLTKADQMAVDVESNQIRSELELLINNAVSGAKREARDSTGESTGTVTPIGTGRKRRKANQVSGKKGAVGKAIPARKSGSLKIDWIQMDDDLIGRYDSLGKTVQLNIDHPFVQIQKGEHNNAALFAVAFSVYSEWVCTNDGDQPLLFEVQGFGSTLGKLMKGMKI